MATQIDPRTKRLRSLFGLDETNVEGVSEPSPPGVPDPDPRVDRLRSLLDVGLQGMRVREQLPETVVPAARASTAIPQFAPAKVERDIELGRAAGALVESTVGVPGITRPALPPPESFIRLPEPEAAPETASPPEERLIAPADVMATVAPPSALPSAPPTMRSTTPEEVRAIKVADTQREAAEAEAERRRDILRGGTVGEAIPAVRAIGDVARLAGHAGYGIQKLAGGLPAKGLHAAAEAVTGEELRTPKEIMEAPETTTGERVAQLAGTLYGAGTLMGAQGRVLGRLGARLPETSRAGRALRAFDPAVPVSRPVAAATSAIEGIPIDLAYESESGRERLTNLALGLGLGAGLGPIFRRTTEAVPAGRRLPGRPAAPPEPVAVPSAAASVETPSVRVGAARGAEPTVAPREPEIAAPAPTPAGADAFAGRPAGREEASFFPGSGERIRTRYRVVEADGLTPSHDPFTFERQPPERFPAEIQGRAYHGARGRGAQEQVVTQAQRFDPDLALDPTIDVGGGPPVVTPQGVAVAGNQRVMLAQRAAREHPDRFAAYRQALEERAPQFGVDPEQVRGMREPVLVREIADPAVDPTDIETLRRLNAASDVPKGKTKDVLSDAATRAGALRTADRSLAHLTETLVPDQTLRQYLETAGGRGFLRELVADGVIPQTEAARYVDAATGSVTDEGKRLVERMLQVAAIGDADVVSRATAGSLAKLEHAYPVIVRAAAVEGWDVAPRIREALDILAGARAAGQRLADYLGQTDLLGRAFSPEAADLARLIDTSPKARVAEVFRAYGDDAAAHARQTRSEDLFGFEPRGPAEAFGRLREPERIAALVPPEGRAPRDARQAAAESFARRLGPQRELFDAQQRVEQLEEGSLFADPKPARGLSAATEQARQTVSFLEGKVQRGTATADQVIAYQEARALLRRGETMDAEDLARVRREGGVEQPRGRLAGPQASLFERRLAGPGGARPLSPRAMSEQLPEAGPFRMGPETEAPRPSDIQRGLAEALGVPVRVGKLGRGKLLRSALGIYKPRARVIRLARAGDITTLGHEMGHDLHALMLGTVRGGLTDDQLALLPGAIPTELDQLARGISDGSLAEGWAEFWRRYIDNPDVLPGQAPDLLRYAEGRLDELNGVRGALQKARDDWRVYREAGPEARFDAKIATKDEPRTATIDDALYRLRRDVVDDMTGLERAQEAILEGKAPLSLDEDAITLARLARGAADEAEVFLERGIIDFNTREISGKGLRQILEPVTDRLDEFRRYATARRVQELHGRDIESGFRIDDANEIVRRYDADPEMRAAFDELQQYNDGLLTYLRDSGVLSDETYALIRERNLNYVPFYRVLDNDRALGGGSKTFGHIFNPTKKIKGSGRDVVDPLESLIKNTYLYVMTARRQQVSNALAQLAERQGAGRFIEELPAPIKPVQLSLGQAESAMRKKLAEIVGDEAVQELERLPKEVADEMLMVFRPGDYFRKENIISVVREGKRVWYEVDPELYRALNALDAEQTSALTKLLSIPARTLRAGAILSPEFMGRNPFRDQLWAYVTSESGYKPFVDLVRGMGHYLDKSDTFWRWKASGGASSSLTSMDRKAMRRTLESLTDTPGARVANVIKNPIEGLRALGELMEYSTRLGEYARAEANFADLGAREAQAYAGLASREIGTDYARHGAKTNAVRLITAFWNARLQGYDRLFRAYKEAPLEVTARAITGITMPSLLLYAVNRNDPDYWEIPLWQRNLFWLVKLPNGTWLRFPKPFEPGLVFGSVPERLLEWADTQDPKAVTSALSELVAGTGLVQLPQAFQPLVENLTNYSFFLGRPIVPRGLEEVEPKYQVTQRTSEAAKWAGRLTGFSPLKIDNLYQSWTGGLGRIASEAATGAIRAGRRLAGEEVPPEPTPTAADIPGLRGFVARTPGVSSESIERFYEQLADAREARRTLGFLAESRQPDEARRVAERRREEIGRLPQLEAAARTLSELRAALDAIRRDPSMTPDDKRDRIDRIGREMTRIAASAIQRKLPAAAEYAGR